ncbi:MAG TPA: NAD-dependent epimerase/dehydratase family protein [Gemmatimonadaceae bacterium]|nr:NAD-dependent epimerase/dehydratase family protein [Gemmatimonadaceae bacterium]
MSGLNGAWPYSRLRRELAVSPRRWLVTGVAGFIGSNLLEELLSLGQTVVGLDNFSTGRQENLDDVMSCVGENGSRFELIRGDIRDIDACRDACRGVDYVLHQAALGSVPRSLDDPATTNAVNVDGFVNMLVAAREQRVRRVVYASSCAVYGDSSALPLDEHNTGQLLSPYAVSKLTNELYAGVFQRAYAQQLVGLRYFNVFGKRQDPSGAYAAVIPRWIANLLTGVRCEIHGDGETSRDFCYIANVTQANLLAALTERSDSGGSYNVACGRETTLNELYRMLRLGLAGYEPSIAAVQPIYGPDRRGDIRRSVADISRIRRQLDYEPTHSTAQGLGEALEWYVAHTVEQHPAVSAAGSPN